MSLLRLACVLTLAGWIGGLAVLGTVVAPTVFTVLEAHDPIAGRTTAGLVFGAIFERFSHLSWGFGALMLALLGARAALGPLHHADHLLARRPDRPHATAPWPGRGARRRQDHRPGAPARSYPGRRHQRRLSPGEAP